MCSGACLAEKEECKKEIFWKLFLTLYKVKAVTQVDLKRNWSPDRGTNQIEDQFLQVLFFL